MNRLRTIAIAATAALGLAAPARAGFTDTFTSGINATYWTLSQTNAGHYTDSTGPGGLTFAYASGSGFQGITMTLNLQAALGVSQINGDFSTQIDISGVSGLGSGIDQVELHTQYANGAIFYDNLGTDNNPSGGFGQNYHVWNGGIQGYTSTTATSGTFVISRTGSTVSGYFNNALIFAETETSALTSIGFVLQNFAGSDPIQATYTNFSATAGAAVPEPSSAIIAASGAAFAAGMATLRRRRRTAARSR